MLTLQQRRFLREYSKTLDAKRAAIFAGYTAKTAAMQAKELLRKEKYARELNEIIEQKADHLEVCSGFIVKKYLQLIDWASGHSANSALEAGLRDRGKPKEPTLLLRALDGLCKHLSHAGLMDEGDENSMLTKIIGLNQERI